MLQRLVADYPNLLAWAIKTVEIETGGYLSRGSWETLPRWRAEVDGASTTCSWIRTEFQRWLKSNGAHTPASEEKLSDNCSTMRRMGQQSGTGRRSAQGSKPDVLRHWRYLLKTPGMSLRETDADAPAFWERVGTNLSAGKLRLVFVADEIPSELRRVVEFLNEQMNRTEVLALEVKQYKERGGDRITLVPRLLGTDRGSQSRRKGSSSRSESPQGGTRNPTRGAVREESGARTAPFALWRSTESYEIAVDWGLVRPWSVLSEHEPLAWKEGRFVGFLARSSFLLSDWGRGEP